jgi:hypothetical protein
LPNPVLVWEYKPYAKRATRPLVSTNRYGFRDRDFETTAKPPGTRRVAFIGDSVTLGLSVQEPKTFVRQLERRANAASPAERIEALNFGIDEYNAVQTAELLRTRVLDFEPDVVVYVFCLNEFDFDDSSGEKLLYFRKPKSFLVRWLRDRISGASRVESHHYRYARNREAVMRGVLAMKDTTARTGAEFLVAVAPVFFTMAPDGKHLGSVSRIASRQASAS